MGSEERLLGAWACLVFTLTACASGEARFPLRDPIWRDTDLLPVTARCHDAPTPEDAHHVSCAPEPYDATLYWDGADKLFFRPLSEAIGLATGGESVNANSVDEVPDSAWFTNRLGIREMSLDELRLNACARDKVLDPDRAPDGAWIIDKGKMTGSTPGFRINVPGKGKYLVKVEARGPERQVAATVMGEAVYYAAGYYASCEQALYVRPSTFKLLPGLTARKGNFGDEYPFDQKALDDLFAKSTMRGGLLRISASAWTPGYVIGQFRYEGTRADDPNDAVAHENRRELRGARLLAAWIDHFDSREGNSLDTWIADAKGGPPDSSPGHVVHYQIGTSAALGSVWDWNEISERLGYSYILDWPEMGTDFITLGAKSHVWDTARKAPGHEIFGYMNVADFDPELWRNEYSNPAFGRMTERDGAWMARILARFTPEMVHTLVTMGQFSDPANTEYLESVLQGRLRKILERYLIRLSPIAGVHVEGLERLCGVNLAELRGLRDPADFRYTARFDGGRWLTVERRTGAQVCVALPHVGAEGGTADDSPQRYVRVRIEDGVAKGPLVAHLYDLGEKRGYRLAGIERLEQ
jgi:hypothetical protein